MSNAKLLNKSEWQEIRNNRSIRMTLAKQELYWFFHIYFSHYVKCETANFHREIYHNVADESLEHIVIVAFRGSGKSTIVTTAFPMWAIIGVLQKKFIVIVSQTKAQAQQHLRNLRDEIETNELFRNDFGKLEEESNEWGISALTMPSLNAKIIAVSREQGIRGMRSGSNRPDLIISDDVEDMDSVKTREMRDKTYEWFTSEILPLGSRQTKYVTVGNLLHEDSLLMRLKDGFAAGTRAGSYFEYPIEKNGKSLWPGMYPDEAALEKERLHIGNRIAWEREYKLNIIPNEDQVITKSMITTYETLPMRLRDEQEVNVAGVDLAISEKDTADYTAIVKLLVRGRGDGRRIYVLPIPINQRMNFSRTIDTILSLSKKQRTHFYIESIAYQEAAVQTLQARGLLVTGVKPQAEKRVRLNMIADAISRGIVVFPKTGCELLISQLTGFGVEKHDDLADALTIAVIEIMKGANEKPSATFGKHHIWSQYGHHGSKRATLSGRDYWSKRLDDFEEATRNYHLY